MTFRRLALVAAQCAVIAFSTMAQAAGDTPQAIDFVRAAAQGDRFEIETSRLALERSRHQAIRDFAAKMIEDHGKASESLAEAAARDNIAMPDGGLDAAHAEKLKALEQAGSDFDAAYASVQVTAHDEAVALFSGYSRSGPKGALRNFADKTLHTIRMHQTQIKALSKP